MFQDTATEDFFRLRLDMMLDLRTSLAVLSSRMPWQQIEGSVVHLFARKVKAGKRLPDLDLFGQGVQTRPDGHPNSPTYGHLKLPHLS